MSLHSPLSFAAGIIATGCVAVAAAAQDSVAPMQPGPVQAASAGTPADARVDKILTRLEGREVRDLHANLLWTLRHVFDEPGVEQVKRGEIWYQDRKPVPAFIVKFDTLISGERLDETDEQHLFDGRWYVERKTYADSQGNKRGVVERRELRSDSDVGNPYRLGEGDFPLPFGQRKADILAEFDVSFVEPAGVDPAQADHLKLIPRTGTRTAQSYKQLDFWISREGDTSGLPVKVRLYKKDGSGQANSEITVRFTEPRLNTGISNAVFVIETPPGYEEIIEPLPPDAQRQPLNPPQTP